MKHIPKKSLGQNFLKSKIALDKIVAAGEIFPEDTILEIGPGKGALTEKLLAVAGKVLAVEKDRNLFIFLQEKFAKEISSGKLILTEDDILNFSIKGDYKIIANIPYNITGAILKKFLGGESQPKMMVLMVQHEVAKRIMARDGKESILSISVKAYGAPKLEMKVPARYFAPSPKVDSAVISIKNISRKFFQENNISEIAFWKIVHAGFAHKRKKLSGNLQNVVSQEKISASGVENKRAEDLTLSDWTKIIHNF